MRKGIMPVLIVLLLGGITFVLVLATMGHVNERVQVVVAAQPPNPGTRITAQMVKVASVHPSAVGKNALRRVQDAVGQVVMVQRLPGDILTKDTVGDQASSLFASALAPDMRAVAVHVNGATGLFGIIRPGDYVSAVAVLDANEILQKSAAATMSESAAPVAAEATPTAAPPQSAAARIVLSHLKVLMVPSSFRYEEVTQTSNGVTSGSSLQKDMNQGVVLLEVPVAKTVVGYLPDGSALEASPVELLSLLEATGKIQLALEPLNAQAATTSGIAADDLLRTMVEKPTPTPEMKALASRTFIWPVSSILGSGPFPTPPG